jgi:hypothetical protein
LQQLEAQGEHLEAARDEQANNWAKAITKFDRLQSPNIQRPSAEVLIQLKQTSDQLVVFNRQNLLPGRSDEVQGGHLQVISAEVLQMILEFAQYLARGIRQLLISLWYVCSTRTSSKNHTNNPG